MWYNIFGTINTLFIFVSLYGVFLQLNKIWQRKKNHTLGATNILSVNQFTMSFLAYFSFFIYGYSIEPFNHFIVWPRLIASMLVLVILYEIFNDRRSTQSLVSITIASTCLLLGFSGLFFMESISIHSKNMSTIMIVVITFLLAQGYAHQISMIIKSGKTGAIDIRMSQFILMMDISTIAFSLTIGLNNGWPLFLLATVSAITKLIIMYLFRWVRVSEIAKN